MAGSFRKIDYRLRPAKHVERVMLCDTFRRLKFEALENYQYVGMGSVYFSDFSLFHRALGVKSMFSIEDTAAPNIQKRFEDNRPFSNIKLLWGSTGDILPALDIQGRSIIWLDYDGRLDLGVLNDVASVISRISSGSVLTISVQCQPDIGKGDESYDFDPNGEKPLLAYAEHIFDKTRLDPKWTELELAGWGTARLFWELLTNEIGSSLAIRNGSQTNQALSAQQVVHFHYSDGAYMLTIGWVFFSEEERAVFDSCNFSGLDFHRPENEAFKISLPLLTLRELRHLERQLPLTGAADFGSIPPGDASKFVSLYRYFPNFAVTSL